MIVFMDKLYNYLKDWLSLQATKVSKSGYLVVATGGLDSALTVALALTCSVDKPATVIFMGFKPELEKILENWIVKTFPTTRYKIVKPIHPEITFEGLDAIDKVSSFIPAYVDLYARANNSLAVGTITRSEYRIVRFFRSRIDDSFDCYPIADLYKSECKQLAKHIGLPDEIINAKSITEDSFGYTFEELEWLDREDQNLSIISSTESPNRSTFWALYNSRNKALAAKVFQLEKSTKDKQISESKLCLARKALPGILS